MEQLAHITWYWQVITQQRSTNFSLYVNRISMIFYYFGGRWNDARWTFALFRFPFPSHRKSVSIHLSIISRSFRFRISPIPSSYESQIKTPIEKQRKEKKSFGWKKWKKCTYSQSLNGAALCCSENYNPIRLSSD